MSAAIWRITSFCPARQLEGKQPADAGVDAGIGCQRRRGRPGFAALAASPPTPIAGSAIPDKRNRRRAWASSAGLAGKWIFGNACRSGQSCFSARNSAGKLRPIARRAIRAPLRTTFRRCALRQAFGQRIDRQHLAGRRRFVGIEPLHARMDHFPAAAVQHRFARQKHFLPAREFFPHVRPD